ncbi:MAG TPA: hypothetical protein VJT31_35285, partial [Rugosimonospora sp.]|nr:hypothetical protein [Rugosimonospora sp.]
FRQARERIQSPSTPGEPLSRQEVAEQANAWIFEQHKKTVALDANYVGKLERGLIRWPHRMYREAFRAVLRVATDAQIGFSGRRRRPATVGPVNRQQFLHLAGSVVALPWLDLFAPIEPTALPRKISRDDIDQVQLASATFMGWDNTYGGGLAREAVHAQLRWSAQLLHVDCPGTLQPDLFAAVAELGGVVGFMAFDAYAHDDARRTFTFSLACAEESKNWHLRASILSMMARQAIWCGQPDTGLTHVETALVRRDRLTATERASLHTLRARALARLRRPQETLAAVGAADDAFAHAKPGDDPPWMAFYDHAQHHGDTAHALWDLSVRGRRTQAAQRLAYSVVHHGAEYARSRTISCTKLATLLMVTGDPRKAAAIGNQALDGAAQLRSRRAIDDLWELHRTAARHQAIIDVAELRDRIVETLGAA